MSETIGTAYVDIRPAPDAKSKFTQDAAGTADAAGREVTSRLARAIDSGLRSNPGQTGLAAGVGAAFGTIVGQGLSAGITRAWRGATDVFRTGLDEVKDYQAGLAQLEAGIKSTGGTAGLTAGQMEKLASGIQAYSGQTDDSIVRAEGFLLTFDRVKNSVGSGNDVFTRATKDAADLAARGFGTAESSAVQLGKALQDPARGLVGLTRVGVTFTEQQKAQIKALTDSGRVLDAQKIILAAVEKQVGGSAKAYGETLPGQIDRSKRAYEDLSQTLLAQAAPALEAVAKGTRGITEVTGRLGPTVPILLGIGGGLLLATKAVKAYQEIQTVLFGGAAKKVAANEAVAASYDGIAVSAGRAAIAEKAAAGGGAGTPVPAPVPAPSGLGGFLKGLGIAGLAVAAFDAAKEGLTPGNTRKHQINIEDWQKEHGYRPKSGGTSADAASSPSPVVDPRIAAAVHALAAARGELNDPTKRDAAISSLMGGLDNPFSELADRTQGSADQIASAKEAQRKADRAVDEARRALTKAQEGSAGASHSQIAAAEASVAQAQAALRKRGGDSTAEQRRLEAAESRLAELRAKGGVNADKLRAAEDRLKEARRTAGQAADDTKKAEATTALSVQDLVGRIGGQLKNTRALDADAHKLVKDGISKGVLDELYKLEKDAPGTLDRVAKGMTPALAKQLDAQYDALQKAQQDFLVQPLRAAVEAAKAEQDKLLKENAEHQAAVYQKALRDAGVELTPKGAPTPTGPGGRPEAPDTSAPAAPTHGAPGPNEHGAPKVVTNVRHYNITGPWVANDPAQVRANLEKLDRLDSLR